MGPFKEKPNAEPFRDVGILKKPYMINHSLKGGGWVGGGIGAGGGGVIEDGDQGGFTPRSFYTNPIKLSS
jgi:hypothetical protein